MINTSNFQAGFLKYFFNTIWIFIEKLSPVVVTFLINVYVIRYLGPAQYGTYTYALSLVDIFITFSALGLTNVLVREIVKKDFPLTKLMGSSLGLRLMGGMVCLLLAVSTAYFLGNDSTTILYVAIMGLGVLFRSFDVLNDYFRAIVAMKRPAITQVAIKLLFAGTRLSLVFAGASLIFFVSVYSLELLVYATGLVVLYILSKEKIQEWNFDKDVAKSLLSDSWPLILSGILISACLNVDKIMIRNFLDETAVGIYGVGTLIFISSNLIPGSIINSLYPALIKSHKAGGKEYEDRVSIFYSIIFWVSLSMTVAIVLFADLLIQYVIGPKYDGAQDIIRLLMIGFVPTSLSIAAGRYLIAENLTRISFLVQIPNFMFNFLLNWLLIPVIGIKGAACATIVASFLPLVALVFFPQTRGHFMLLLRAIVDLGFIGKAKKIIMK